MQGIHITYCLGLLVVVVIIDQTDASIHLDGSQSFSANIPNAFNYSAFLIKHEKWYKPLEEMSRAKLFYLRSIDIFKSNVLYATHKKSHYLHQNRYIDFLPTELDRILLATDSDLVPVKEAKDSPDTPAIEFIAGAKRRSDLSGIDDMISRSTLSDISQSEVKQHQDEAKRHQEPVSFTPFQRYPDVDPTSLLRELVKHPSLMEEMSKYITINEQATDSDYSRMLESKKRKMIHEHVVEPTNPRFDPSTIQSRGAVSDMFRLSHSSSDFLMDDFLGVLEPYPTPVVEENSSENENQGVLSSFIDTLRAFRDSFIIAGDYEIEGNNAEKTKLVKESDNSAPSDDQNSKKTGIEYKIDWRQNGCIPRIKDQGKCNSCYAFAALDLLEYIYCRQTGSSTEFSAQYMIDCGVDANLEGCSGGKLTNVKNFISSRGLQVDSLYPYKGVEQICPYQNADQHSAYLLKPEIRAWAMFSELIDWYKWIPTSPLIVGINMPADFLAYGGGVHKGLDCVPKMVHAMLLVGAGKEDGHPFWLLKNSLSEEWGEKGYFRLSREAPVKCFNSVFVARVTFKQPAKKSPLTGVKRRFIS